MTTRAAAILLAAACLVLGSGLAWGQQTDAEALLQFKAGLKNTGALNWAGTNACAGWTGVTCTNGRVTRVAVPGLTLRGTLPAGLDMPTLLTLDLSSNRLSGTLPSTLALPELTELGLSGNRLNGPLPATWAFNFPQLGRLQVQGNELQGTMPTDWVVAGAFSGSLTAAVQPGNAGVCGSIDPAPGYSLVFAGTSKHTISTTLGTCATGTCGQAAVNASAPNLYDVSWSNGGALLDVSAANPGVLPEAPPEAGTPISIPCYPEQPPTYFGAVVSYLKSAWQSSTEGDAAASRPVSVPPGSTIAPGGECSATAAGTPGWWVVDLQQAAAVQAVLIYAGGSAMAGITIRVGDSPAPAGARVCTTDMALAANSGSIFACTPSSPTGRFVFVLARGQVSLCKVEVYPLLADAALGKAVTSSAAGSAGNVVNGQLKSCATVVSNSNLAAWITIDLGYSGAVETVVISNGDSTFNNDLFIRVGDTETVAGDENPPCSAGLTMSPSTTLPVHCSASGRYVTLYRKLSQPSDIYLCEVYVYLANGPSAFPAPMSPPPGPPLPPAAPPTVSPPASPPPFPSPVSPIGPTTAALGVVLLLQGPGLSPLTEAAQRSILAALELTWVGQSGMTSVTPLAYTSPQRKRLRLLLASGDQVARVVVGVTKGQAPGAAAYVESSVSSGDVAAELEKQGLPGVTVTLNSIAPADPIPPGPPASSGGAPIGAIVGGVVGGIALLAVAAGIAIMRRRRRRQGAGGKAGKRDDGVMAVLVVNPDDIIKGPAHEAPVFREYLSPEKDGIDLSPAPAVGAPTPPQLRPARSGTGAELPTVRYGEMEIQNQIGEGSFGKVYLARWREITVAVKKLSGSLGANPSLDEEFKPDHPAGDASDRRGHPIYESLQKEAAMMASLRHPAIVMYLGVCLDPPCVVTEYCARGSLSDVLKRANTSAALAQSLDWARRLNMALDAAKGMLYLHSCSPPIIHRDLKSPNLLVDRHWRIKVCDFNLSRAMEDSAVLSSLAATNPRWLAPEILSGTGCTFASDVFSFGVILWEFLTWQLPWHECGDNLWPLVARVLDGERLKVPGEEGLPTPAFPGLPDYLRLMEDCWLADPAARPSFKDIISRLRKLLEAESMRLREAAGSPSKLLRGSRPDLLNPESSTGSLTAGAGDASVPSPYASPTKRP